MAHLLVSLKEFIKPTGSPTSIARKSINKRAKLLSKIEKFLPFFSTFLIVAGFIYIGLLPAKFLGRGHYVSENALQPAQVNTYWTWADVHVADKYAADVQKWVDRGLSSEQRAQKIRLAFESMGLRASTQAYSFTLGSSNQKLSGVNVHSILQAPKTDGAEAIVLSASWLSRAVDENGERRVNVRGVAIVLALANYLMKSSMWSKDLILLISDGYSDGSQAWLDSYHGYDQTNLFAESLAHTTGSIWIALNVDYPHHSFKAVGIYYEGVNGHLPNLDYINSVSWILKHAQIPVVLHSSPSHPSVHSSIFSQTPLDIKLVREFVSATKNLWYQLSVGARGGASGPESVYGRYRIDAINVFAIPGETPYGFHDLGNIIESILRSLNNLLERFHQSFFLYIMTSVDSFIAVGNYLAAPILISAGMTISGLTYWGEASGPIVDSVVVTGGIGLKTGGIVMRWRRPVGPAVLIIGLTQLIGVGLFWFITSLDPTADSYAALPTTLLATLFFTPVFLSYIITPSTSTSLPRAPLSTILKSFNLILGGLTIAVTATLNFGASIALCLILSLPLLLAKPVQSEIGSRLQQFILVCISPIGIWSLWRLIWDDAGADEWLRSVLVGYAIEGGWSLGLAVMVVSPLVLQAATGALL